jgi:arsenite methyltransferase
MDRFTTGLYESGVLDELLGDTLHPGGIELTKRLTEVAKVSRGSTVLDIASGRGSSAAFLSQQYGCKVIGIDSSFGMVTWAQKGTQDEQLTHLVQFLAANAEDLPFAPCQFDIAICECSFSLFPNKEKVAAEIWRVLKLGGRLALADIFLRHRVAPALKARLNSIPCLAQAQGLTDYLRVLEQAGFQDIFVEDHSRELKKIAGEAAIGYGSLQGFLTKLTAESGITLSTQAYLDFVKKGKPGYALIAAAKLRGVRWKEG